MAWMVPPSGAIAGAVALADMVVAAAVGSLVRCLSVLCVLLRADDGVLGR
jgi:hypothetical protein